MHFQESQRILIWGFRRILFADNEEQNFYKKKVGLMQRWLLNFISSTDTACSVQGRDTRRVLNL